MFGSRESAAFVALILLTAQTAEPVSLYGLQLGVQPTVPRCANSFFGNYDSGPTCWTPDPAFPSEPGRHPLRLHFGATKPEISTYPFAAVFTGDDGTVDMIEVFTTGAKSQNDAYRQLTMKFGNPTEEMYHDRQTLGGLRFTSITAIWKLGDDEVILDGIGGSLDSGLITATTRRGHAAMDAATKAKRGAEPQL